MALSAPTPAFVPGRRLLVVAAGLLPLAVLAALLGMPWSLLLPAAAALVVITGLAADGFRGPAADELVLSRELPRRLEVGTASSITLRLRNRGSRTWTVVLSDGCPPSLCEEPPVLELVVPPGAEATATYEVHPRRRGALSFGSPLLRILGRAGWAEHIRTMDLPGEARVLPGLEGLRRHRLRARRDLMHLGGARRMRVLGRDGDFDRLRDFVPGDDVRHVDWKATARLRRPIARVWQAEKAQNLVVLVDGTRLMATRAGDLTKLDHAVRAALTLSWAGLAAGDRVAVGVFDDRMRTWIAPASGTSRFGALLDGLYDQQPEDRFPRYQEVARHLLRLLSRRSLVVWLTDVLDLDQGKELLSALTVLRSRHLSLVVALDDPQVRALAAVEPQDRSALYLRTGAVEVLDERRVLLRRLRAAGAQVLDEPTERLGPELVDRYLDIKMRGQL
ncbi:MAG: DUF58 domain-containing protein [Deltaproteobacteria bacterium]|nr:DUF58 domain-containing protein [Deltaproteobacteria bacterium]